MVGEWAESESRAMHCYLKADCLKSLMPLQVIQETKLIRPSSVNLCKFTFSSCFPSFILVLVLFAIAYLLFPKIQVHSFNSFCVMTT